MHKTSLPTGTLQHGCLYHQNQEGRESARMTEVTIVCGLIMEVTSHQLIYWLEESLSSLPHLSGEESLNGVNIRKQGKFGASLNSGHHKCSTTKTDL